MAADALSVDRIISSGGIGRYQVKICIIGILTLVADGFDLQILAYLMPQIVKEWQIPVQFQGTILSGGYLGMMIGFLVLAPLSARLGLKRMVVSCLIIMGLFNLATAFVTGPNMLLALRIATGLVIGGLVPPAIALVVEYFPERYRASVVTIMYVGTSLGFLTAGWAAWLIVRDFGWRPAIVLSGVIPLLLSVIVCLSWPESLEFLINRASGGVARAKAILSRMNHAIDGGTKLSSGRGITTSVSLLDLFRDGRLFGTVALWIGLVMNAVVYFFVLSWLPLILVRIGASQENAIFATSLVNLGGIAAAFVTGPLMDTFGAYRIVVLHFVVGTIFAAVVGFVLSPTIVVIVPAALCLGFCVSGLHKGISALTMRFYPTELRSAGLGWVFGIGRVGAIAGPMLAGLLMGAGWSPASIFYFMCLPLLLGGVGIGIMWNYYERRAAPIARRSIVTGAAKETTQA